MKKTRLFSLMAATMIATAASANFEYPEGSGVYYDIDDVGKAFVQWVDVSKVAGEVTIASEVNFEENNYAVTYFGEYGKFYGSTGMTKVTIPASIDSIPEYWFQGCTNLEAVVIGSKKIGGNAFRGNAKLKDITLQEGVELIYSAALCELPLLETITLPSTLTLLGSWQFYNDTSLKEITFLGDVKIILTTLGKVFKRDGITEEGCDTATDLGDYLLASGKITREQYDRGQKEARRLIAEAC